ncbi:HEL302Cp [Eremothecium sinecaudum]|uniref:RING-type E3 ubiquitin transferase (cysteine targeting) n=1 Tax=Eremothecium sinecaudum TaxID=45286 RepID=A0A0X8HT62_9SACH|nr:HEL302Cp [Eremothecium sinecaudum]AMD20979.1 HEL302Cp [Eremothecium sinecaudum]
MSSVAQLDSLALDSELHESIWNEFQSHFKPINNIDEWQLLIHTLVFYLSTHTNLKGVSTYGSQLSGVTYQTTKSTLFLVSVLVQFLHKKFSSAILRGDKFTKWYLMASKLYHCYDLFNFLQFLSTPCFISPIHRLFNVTCTKALEESTFYTSTVYAGLEFQNRQLMWNTILELLNKNVLQLNYFSRQQLEKNETPTRQDQCARCKELPVNPYSSSCCRSTYCYVCLIRNLDVMFCSNCGTKKTFTATPLYAAAKLEGN